MFIPDMKAVELISAFQPRLTDVRAVLNHHKQLATTNFKMYALSSPP